MSLSVDSVMMPDPPMASPEETTRLIRVAADGDRGATDRLFAMLYEHLRAVAGNCLVGRADRRTLGPTALVHEAFVKLSAGQEVDWQGKTHFIAVAVRAMRQVLIDHERGRLAQKRGGGASPVRLEDVASLTGGADVDAEGLERALRELASFDPRAAQVVELRFFGGLTGEQIGGMLGVSVATVKKDWRFAKAWLRQRLGGAGCQTSSTSA